MVSTSNTITTSLAMTLVYVALIPGCARVLPSNAKGSQARSAAQIAETGLLFESQGRTENAIECFEKALALEPSSRRLKDKIARLKQTPERTENRQAISKLDDVLLRHERHEPQEFNSNETAVADQPVRTVSHGYTDETEFDDALIGRQSSFRSQDAVLED